ncbi:hypothetical protein HY68_12505 [Streptomyces sp. AcH 505]|nr:hypothetical protein HY68_12505 [Streptomyces sp. AcH 505]
MTFSLTFGQPISYFFLPPDVEGKDVVIFMHHQNEGESTPPFGVNEFDLLECAMPLRFSAEVVDGVNRVMRKRGQVWSPGTPDLDWYRPEEWVEYEQAPGEEEERAAEERHEEWERKVYDHQKEVARKAEARLTSEEYGALIKVHSAEVAKLLADEMMQRGMWNGRRTTRTGDPFGRDAGGKTDSEQPPF